MARKGGNSQDRRRARRAASRRTDAPVASLLDFDELVASAMESPAPPAEALPEDAALAQVLAVTGADDEPTMLAEATGTDGQVVGRVFVKRDGLAAVTAEMMRNVEFVPDSVETDGIPVSDAFEQVAARFRRHLERMSARASHWSTFAAGDVAWGPEDGFIDLLCDVNELLRDLDDSGYYRAVDVGVQLDKVLICDYEDESYWSSPLSIDADGEPVLAPRDEWVQVEEESSYVEVSDDESAESDPASAPDEEASRARELSPARIRFELRDIVLTAAAVADADVVGTLPDEHKPGDRQPRRTPTPMEPTPPAGAATTARSGDMAWQAIFVPEATLTDDGRAFAPGSLTWRELPLSLMAMTETSAQGGHDGAVLAGRIDRIWREGNLVLASGVFDRGEFGQEIARMVGDETLRGLSVDTAIHSYEVAAKSDYFDENGEWRTDVPTRDEAEEPSVADMLFGDDTEDRIFVVHEAVIGMATVCPFPAFAGACVSLVASGGGALWRYSHQGAFTVVERPLVAAAAEVEEDAATDYASMTDEEREASFAALVADGLSEAEARGTVWPDAGEGDGIAEGLTASGAGRAPLKPPLEWFETEEADALTPVTVTDDGRIFGHAWSWDTCHISFPDACVLAPHSDTENAYFHLGEVECEGGERLSVGKVTLDAPHAGPRLSRASATAHYDHTGTVAAHVRCVEGQYGGWVSGAIAPDLSDEKRRLLQGSALSGDWRNVNGNLELVALLAVNVPGFPVPRPRALVAAGAEGTEEVLALTAAGIVLDEQSPCDTVAEIAELAAEVGAAPPDGNSVAGDFAALLEQARG